MSDLKDKIHKLLLANSVYKDISADDIHIKHGDTLVITITERNLLVVARRNVQRIFDASHSYPYPSNREVIVEICGQRYRLLNGKVSEVPSQ